VIAALLGRFWRELSALAAAVAAVGAIYLKGRRDAARDAERTALKRAAEAREKADAEAARYRGDGAARRLRDGRF
jgi:Arc/MetJ family transcription regulator